MKPKKLEKKKPLNKWKITAIISLAINGLVAVLLAVGLCQPKTEKTSAYSLGDYYVYANRNDTKGSDFSYYSYNSLTNWNQNYYDNNLGCFFLSKIFPSSSYSADYLDTSLYVNAIYCRFYRVEYIENNQRVIDYWLKYINIVPYGGQDDWRNVFTCNFNENTGEITSTTYQSLGLDSPYIFLPRVQLGDTISFFDSIFMNYGTNEILTDFEISDNWNPNKYISLVTDSIGLLYDSPSAVTGGVIDGIKGVVWSNPFYDGITATSQPYGVGVSSLGFLEIPLLFTSNGENFVGIRIYYDVVQNYVDKNNEVQTFDYGSSYSSHLFHYTFVYMSYVYELSNYYGSANYNWREKVVCAVPVYRTLVSYIDNNTWKRNFIYEVYQPYTWLSDNYKTISVFEASTPYLDRVGFSESLNTRSLAINNLTIRQILEYDMTQNDYGVNTSGYVGIGNVFILIGDAFSAVLPLLAVTIVPGLSIGMLLFLPVVLTIIIVVIKLVKR